MPTFPYSRRHARVAPREGAWIEMTTPTENTSIRGVAPREGAWIEMCW